MAAAGAAAGVEAGKAAAPAGGGAVTVTYTIKSLGRRPSWRGWRTATVAAALALLAAGGVAFAVSSRLVGHPVHPGATPSAAVLRPGFEPARLKPRAAPVPPRGRNAGTPPLEVAGVGCPANDDDAVTLHDAPAGPGWMPAGGGWTGDGCDGRTLWTMDPNGKQQVPSMLTWTFAPMPEATRCALAVFVPTQNAVGMSDYSVIEGPESRVVAAVPVSQAAMAGQWVTLGVFPVSASPLEITAAAAPGAQQRGHHGAIAASAASARCT